MSFVYPAAAVPGYGEQAAFPVLDKRTCMSQRHFVQNNLVMLVTTVTLNREPLFRNPAIARIAVETIFDVQKRYPFELFGFVVMPNHIHLLLRVPETGSISKIMNIYKSGMTFNTGIRQLWQRRFDIRIVNDIQKTLHYVHRNPVAAGLSKTPESYPWGSASGRWHPL